MKRLVVGAILVSSVSYRANHSASCFQLQSIPSHQRRKRPRREIVSLLSSQTPNNRRKIGIVLPNVRELPWHADAVDRLNQIATRLDLPFVSLDPNEQSSITGSSSPASFSHLLTAVPYPLANSYALAIHVNTADSSSKRKKQPRQLKLDPIFVDLCPQFNTRLGYRMNQKESAGGGEELLLKALGLKKMLSDKKGEPLIIYDLTAGLARDALIILNAFIGRGAELPSIRLHMMERDEAVAALVLDAMRRLRLAAQLETTDTTASYAERAQQLLKCLTMEEGDAVDVLDRLLSTSDRELSIPFPPDVCYLDPMFPPRKKKSSAVKKDMTMLHSLLGSAVTSYDNVQAENMRVAQERKMLNAACNSAKRRVVVKRPIGSPPLGCFSDEDITDDFIIPSYDIRGSVNRWDVYLIS